MFFSDYKKEENAKAVVNPVLLWEYDLSNFDYNQMRNIVVQRVIERGWPNDWYAILNRYGEEGVKEAIKTISYLNDKDMNFVSLVFQIPLNEMKCYTRKQSHLAHWNS